jgi:predicted type IV restriction endonuclease
LDDLVPIDTRISRSKPFDVYIAMVESKPCIILMILDSNSNWKYEPQPLVTATAATAFCGFAWQSQ